MDGAVLIIHDEQGLRAAARQALLQAGRQVAEAAEVAAALVLAECIRPVVIVLPWLGRRPAREALAQLRDATATRRSRLIVWAEQGDMPSAVHGARVRRRRLPRVAARAVGARRARQRVPATCRSRWFGPISFPRVRSCSTKPCTGCSCRGTKWRSRRPSSACWRSCSRTRAASSAATSCCAARGRRTSRPAAGLSTCTCAACVSSSSRSAATT